MHPVPVEVSQVAFGSIAGRSASNACIAKFASGPGAVGLKSGLLNVIARGWSFASVAGVAPVPHPGAGSTDRGDPVGAAPQRAVPSFRLGSATVKA